MQVRDGMSEVSVTVGPSHALRQAAAAMVDAQGRRRVGDRRRGAGAGDRHRARPAALGRGGEDPDVEPVGAHMTGSVIAAAPDWSLEHAAAEMSRRGVRHLVVFDDGEVVGILSMRDIVRVWTSAGATSEMPLPSGRARERLRGARRRPQRTCWGSVGRDSRRICSTGRVALRVCWRFGRLK